jgi:hypothetical protein
MTLSVIDPINLRYRHVIAAKKGTCEPVPNNLVTANKISFRLGLALRPSPTKGLPGPARLSTSTSFVPVVNQSAHLEKTKSNISGHPSSPWDAAAQVRCLLHDPIQAQLLVTKSRNSALATESDLQEDEDSAPRPAAGRRPPQNRRRPLSPLLAMAASWKDDRSYTASAKASHGAPATAWATGSSTSSPGHAPSRSPKLLLRRRSQRPSPTLATSTTGPSQMYVYLHLDLCFIE